MVSGQRRRHSPEVKSRTAAAPPSPWRCRRIEHCLQGSHQIGAMIEGKRRKEGERKEREEGMRGEEGGRGEGEGMRGEEGMRGKRGKRGGRGDEGEEGRERG